MNLAGDFICEGFTSNGIVDNASAEMLKVEDLAMTLGGTADATFNITHGLDTRLLSIAGGTGADSARFWLYGGAHSRGGDLRMLSGSNMFFNWDEDVGSMTLYSGTGSYVQFLWYSKDSPICTCLVIL